VKAWSDHCHTLYKYSKLIPANLFYVVEKYGRGDTRGLLVIDYAMVIMKCYLGEIQSQKISELRFE